MSAFFRATSDTKRELFPSMIRGWQWYQFLFEEVDRSLWYTIPRKVLFHPFTYQDNDVCCTILLPPKISTPSESIASSMWIPPSSTVLDVAHDDKWNGVFYAITAVLVLVIVYLVFIMYTRLHTNGWFDLVTGSELFEFVAMI